MFPDLRATPNVRAKLSYCRVTRRQSGSMDIVQLLTTGTKFRAPLSVFPRYRYGDGKFGREFCAHTAYMYCYVKDPYFRYKSKYLYVKRMRKKYPCIFNVMYERFFFFFFFFWRKTIIDKSKFSAILKYIYSSIYI